MSPTLALRLTGTASAILFLIALALLGELLGAFGDPDHVFIDYYDDTGNRARGLIGAVTLFAAALTFLAFTELWLRIADPDASTPLAGYLRGLAIAFTALVLASSATLATVDLSRAYADLFDETEGLFERSSVVVLPQLGYVLLLAAGGWTAAVIVAVACLFARSTGSLPGLAIYVGFVIAVLLLLSPMVMPFVLFPLWLLLVTFTTRRRAEAVPS